MVDLLSAYGYLMNVMSHASPLPFAGILQGLWGFGLAQAFLHCRPPCRCVHFLHFTMQHDDCPLADLAHSRPRREITFRLMYYCTTGLDDAVSQGPFTKLHGGPMSCTTTITFVVIKDIDSTGETRHLCVS